jgi:hypothetical protein
MTTRGAVRRALSGVVLAASLALAPIAHAAEPASSAPVAATPAAPTTPSC